MNRLDEIRQRAEAATPGPWEAVSKGNSIQSNAVVSAMYGDGPKLNICPSTTNAAFIAHSREDIPYLLSEVAELTELLNASKAGQVSLQKAWEQGKTELTARAEAAEARADAA